MDQRNMEERLKQSSIDDRCQQCGSFRCFCQMDDTENADTKHSTDKILDAFTENMQMQVPSECYSKPMDKLHCLEIKSRNCSSFTVCFSRKNESILSYLLRSLAIQVEDPLIMLALASLNNSTVSLSYLYDIVIADRQTGDCYENFSHDFRRSFDKQSYLMMKALYSIFTSYSSLTSPLEDNKIVQYQKHFVNVNQSHYKIFDLCRCYFLLHNDYSNLENINVKLINKIKELEIRLRNISEQYEAVKYCKICPRVKEELQIAKENYNGILKNFSNAQAEKERMVMKYATSERRLLEAQKSIKQIEKKHQDTLTENTTIQKKLQKANETIAKLNSDINNKYSEITQLRNQIEHNKTNDNAKEMKLKWAQNRLKIVTDAHAETQKKLNEALTRNAELTSECESLRSQASDKEQQARLILERHDAEKSENERARLQKDLEAKLGEVVAVLEEERRANQTLRNDLVEMEALKNELRSLADHISALQSERELLLAHNEDLRFSIQTYEQRELERLGFTEKLTQHNVHLQQELEDALTRQRALEASQSPLRDGLERLRGRVAGLDRDLATEKASRQEDCELLAKCIAEQAVYNRRLLHRLEDLEGENGILRKRYDLAIREMSRELHHQQQAKATGSGAAESAESEEKYIKSKMDELLEKEKLFDQIIKLQKINVKRAEKLDFMEEHSHALLHELQRKTKMLQKYGNHGKNK